MLNELRCSNPDCGKNKKSPKLLGQAFLTTGSVIEIKCSRCKAITSFEAKAKQEPKN